jgi:hypothetical protein
LAADKVNYSGKYSLRAEKPAFGNDADSLLDVVKNEDSISLAQWMAHMPHQLVNQHLKVGGKMIDAIPREKIVNTPL